MHTRFENRLYNVRQYSYCVKHCTKYQMYKSCPHKVSIVSLQACNWNYSASRSNLLYTRPSLAFSLYFLLSVSSLFWKLALTALDECKFLIWYIEVSAYFVYYLVYWCRSFSLRKTVGKTSPILVTLTSGSDSNFERSNIGLKETKPNGVDSNSNGLDYCVRNN